MKKTAILLLLVMMIVLLLSSCSSSSEQKVTEQKEIVLYTWTDDHYFRHMASRFEQEYGITVRIVATRAESYIRKALKEREQPSGSIDLMLINDSYHLEQLQEAGILSKDSASDVASLRNGASSSVFLPLYRVTVGFLYNRELLPDPPKTWEAFTSWIDEHPDRFGFTVVGGEAGFSFIFAAYNALLSRIQDSESEGEEPWEAPDDRSLEHVWSWFRDHQEYMLYTSSDFDSIRLLLSGRLLLTSALEHQVLRLLEQKRSDTPIVMYVPDFGALSQTYGLAVPGNTESKEEVFQFLQFISTAEAQQYMEQNLHVRAVPSSPVRSEQGKELITPATYGWWESLSPVIHTPEGFNYRWFIDSFTDGVLYH